MSRAAKALDRELLYAIWATEVLVGSGVGLETALKHVADGDYGGVSERFRAVLKDSEAGIYLADSLMKLYEEAPTKGFKFFVHALAKEARNPTGQLVPTLKAIADAQTRTRRSRLEAFIKKLDALAEVYMAIAMIIPIVAIVFAIVYAMTGGALGLLGVQSGGGSSAYFNVLLVLLAIDLVASTALLVSTKTSEPEV